MGEQTGIPWATSTFNCWVGCTRVSPACEHCYAESLNKRFGHDNWGPKAARRRTSANNWNEPRRWDRKAAKTGQPWRVFCASMADVFDDHQSILPEWREDLWQLIRETPNLTWMLLTKRPQNIKSMLPDDLKAMRRVWPGTTTENQEWASERIPYLLASGCKGVHWLSIEPMLGPIDLTMIVHADGEKIMDALSGCYGFNDGDGTWELSGTGPKVGWAITGEESGHGRRPLNRDWPRSIRDQCAEYGTAFFHKQEIIDGKKVELPLLDGRQHAEFPQVAA